MTTPMYVRDTRGNSPQSYICDPAKTDLSYYYNYPVLANSAFTTQLYDEKKETVKPDHIMADSNEFGNQTGMVVCKFPNTTDKKVESIDDLFANSELFTNLENKDLAKDKTAFIQAIDKTIKWQSVGEVKILNITTMPFSAMVSIEIFTHSDDLSVKRQTKFVTTTNPAKFTQLINRTFADLNQQINALEDELSDME